MTPGVLGLVVALFVADEAFLRAGKDVPLPQAVEHTAPAFPDLARQARLMGIVVLDVGISEKGRVVDIKVVRGEPILAGPAVEAAKRWTYAPTLVDGVPKRVAVAEVVELFPGEGSRADYFLDMLKNRKEPPAFRLLALDRLRGATGKRLEKLQATLLKLSKEDPDDNIRGAAVQALAQPGAK